MASKSHAAASSSGSLDLWALAEEEYANKMRAQALQADDSAAPTAPIEQSENDENNVVLFIGDSSSGKSSLIQGFLKPNASSKDPKPTVALEYNFARKKNTGKNGNDNGKIVAHIWELGGDNLHEPKLLELPLSTVKQTGCSSAVILCVDLSAPQQFLTGPLHWLRATTDLLSKRYGKSKQHVSPSYKGHPDESRVRPCPQPLFIIGTKYDLFKSRPQADRRLALQILRFIAHYFGATLAATSVVDPSMRDSYRGIISAINFKQPQKSSIEINIDKPFYVSPGSDNFSSILLGNDGVGKSKLAQSEADLGQYIGSSGLVKDAWARLSEHLRSVFGDPTQIASNAGEEGDLSAELALEHPESEVDAMRAQRDLVLERYVQEKERREATLMKLNAVGGAQATELDDEGGAPSRNNRK